MAAARPSSLPLPALPRWLAVTDIDGQRCAGLVILAGVVLGAGLVQLFTSLGGQTSRFSLELLALVVLQLAGPLLVSLLAILRLSPDWQERSRVEGREAWRSVVLPAVPLGALLMLMFLASAMGAGVLVTPRTDSAGEIRELLANLRGADVLRTVLRTSVFLAAAAAWSLRLHRSGLRRQRDAVILQNDSLLQSVTLVLVLKLFWILVVDPIRLGLPT
ncbi:MAG: hypothetical protein VKJ63_04630 [Synechococcus sp.]|nr:hypothetical protein [Synechococcus sp.]